MNPNDFHPEVVWLRGGRHEPFGRDTQSDG
jgi:hypothetical protein